MDNIIANPTETKFHKIRCENATFKEKVIPVFGATELLYAAGFRQEKLEINGNQEDVWMWNEENVDSIQTLEVSVSVSLYKINLMFMSMLILVLERCFEIGRQN